MTKQIINTNSPDDLINVGNTANDRRGDSLRAAFIKLNNAADKIDANFAELYAQQAAEATDRIVSGDSELIITSDENGGAVSFPAHTNGKIGVMGVELGAFPADIQNPNPIPLVLSSYNGEILITPNAQGPRPGWSFDQSGTIHVPVPEGGIFTLTLSSANYVATEEKPTLTLSGTPWVFEGSIQRNPDGSAQLLLDNPFPNPDNPGYTSNDTFTFDDQVHHLYGYELTVVLEDVVLPGGAGWTANVAVSELPDYPKSLTTTGALVLHGAASVVLATGTGVHEEQFKIVGRTLTLPSGLVIGNDAINKSVETINGEGFDTYGSRLSFTDNTTTLESYNDPDGPNNTQYGRISTGVMTASLSAYQEDVSGLTGAELTLTTSGVVITQGDGVLNNSLTFNGDGLTITNDLQFGNSIRYSGSINVSVDGGATTTIFTAQPWMTSLKLVITVEGRLDGDDTNTDHTQTCEATVAASYNTNAEPVMSVYGSVYTSPAPLATFTVSRGLGNVIIVEAINSQTTSTLYVRSAVIQFVSYFD